MFDNLERFLGFSRYVFCIFDNEGKIKYKNKSFSECFGEAKDFLELKDKALIHVKTGLCDCRQTLIFKNLREDGIVSFEVVREENDILALGTKVEFEDLISFSEGIMEENKVLPNFEKTEVFWNESKSPIVTVMLDFDGNITRVTDNISIFFGEKDYLNKNLEEVFPIEIGKEVLEKLKYVEFFKEVSFECDGYMVSLLKFKGKYSVVNIYPYSKGVQDKLEELNHLNRKIKKLEWEIITKDKFIKSQKDIFENIVRTDELTKSYNRKYLNEKFALELEKAKGRNISLCFTLINIESFKDINMTYGVKAGDMALKSLSQILKSRMRDDKDFIFRVGSDEFALLSVGVKSDDLNNFMNEISWEYQITTGYNIRHRSLEVDENMSLNETLTRIYN